MPTLSLLFAVHIHLPGPVPGTTGNGASLLAACLPGTSNPALLQASLRNAGMDALKDDDGNPTTKMDVSFQNDTLLTSMQARLQPLSNYHGAEFMLAGCDVYDTTRGTEQRKRLGTLTITPQKRYAPRSPAA